MDLGNLDVFKNKYLLIVRSGLKKKEPILRKIKELGLKIILVNPTRNWAVPYVDYWINVDTSNTEKVVTAIDDFLDSNRITIDGVLTYSEEAVLLTAKLATKFKTKSNPVNLAMIARDKILFREFCRENNLPFPWFKRITSVHDLKNMEYDFPLPLVMKPQFGSNSSLVRKINTRDQLETTYREILSLIGKDQLRHAENKDFLLEEYIEGAEVDVDVLIQNKKIICSVISDNKIEEPFFLETGRIIPSQLSMDIQNQINQMTEAVLTKMQLTDCCVHFEAKYNSRGPIPLEVNLRLGGDEVYPSVKLATGVDYIENMVRIALGLEVKIDFPKNNHKHYVSYDFLADKSGTLLKLEIDERYLNFDFYKGHQFFKSIGDIVQAPPEGSEYLGWIMAEGNSYAEARENLKKLIQCFQYEIA